MKKLMFALAVAICSVASAEMKFGTVDLMLLVRNHPDYERNKTFLSDKDKDGQKKLAAMKKEGDDLQAEGRKLAEQFRNPMLSDKAKAPLEKQLMEIQQSLMKIEQNYRAEALRIRQELQEDEGRLLKATTDDLRKRIAKFATDNGYDMIFDKNAAPYSRESLEVTDALLKDMGVEPRKAKGRDESK